KRAVLIFKSFKVAQASRLQFLLNASQRFAPSFKKSARELRQGGSNYRCCIPALAGFVSPQSIAPDGRNIFAQDRSGAIWEIEMMVVGGANNSRRHPERSLP